MPFGRRTPDIRLSDLTDSPIISVDPPGPAIPCNPSIAKDDSGFRAIVRGVNYRLDEEGGITDFCTETIRSINWLAAFDPSLNLTELKPIDDSRYRNCYPAGFEDCRLFRWRGAWWFSASAVKRWTSLLVVMVLCRLEGATVTECITLAAPNDAPVEKNWMPCVDRDALSWIYRIDPLQIVRYRSRARVEHGFAERKGWLGNWFGSSQGVRFGRGWLCVVHRRRRRKTDVYYEHKLLELDADFRVKRASPSFFFEMQQIEFCAGLCLHGDDLILSYGVHDKAARLMRVKQGAAETPAAFLPCPADRDANRARRNAPGKSREAAITRFIAGAANLGMS